MSVVVFGSINMDLTTYASRLPRLGETLLGTDYNLSAGGKGANQAVGAARLGAQTAIVGRVGEDMFGPPALQALDQAGVSTSAVAVDPEHATGLAVISVDSRADNAIVVISGANMALATADVERAQALLPDAKVLLLQLEVPLPASLALAREARARGTIVVFDPAPAQPLSDDILSMVDILTPNELEAETLVGYAIDSREAAASACADLVERGTSTVIVTLGKLGASYATDQSAGFQHAFQVEAIDSVAAGDAFNAGLAAGLDQGLDLEKAVAWGAAAGALATTRRGAIPAMPTRSELLQLMNGSGEV